MLIWCWLRDEIEMRSPSLLNCGRHALVSSRKILQPKRHMRQLYSSLLFRHSIVTSSACKRIGSESLRSIISSCLSLFVCFSQTWCWFTCVPLALSQLSSQTLDMCVFPQEAWTTRFTLISRKKREKSETHGWEGKVSPFFHSFACRVSSHWFPFVGRWYPKCVYVPDYKSVPVSL